MYKLNSELSNTIIRLQDGFQIPLVGGNSDYEEVKQWLSEGNTPEPEFTDAELLANAILRFESVVDAFIQSKIDVYNASNGVKFRDIDAFTKYAMNTASTHNVIANKFIVYADKIWKIVRDYQAVATAIPTDVEFQAVLDGVVF